MKKITTFSIVMVLMMGLCMTSCLKGNNNDEQEKQWQEWVNEVNAEIRASIGSYGGKMYLCAANKEREDSVVANWGIASDSTMVLSAVPLSWLVKKMPENQKALQTAIAERGTSDILVKTAYNYRFHSPLDIYIYPQPIKLNVSYEGKAHQVEIHFYNTESNTNSRAQYLQYSDKELVNLCLLSLSPESIYLDGQRQHVFQMEYYIWWYGSKK